MSAGVIPDDEVPVGVADPSQQSPGPDTRMQTAIGAAAGAGAVAGAAQMGQMGIRGNLWANVVQSTFAAVVIIILITTLTAQRIEENSRIHREDQREVDRINREDKRDAERQRRDDQREQYMREDLREQRSLARADAQIFQKQLSDNTAAIREAVDVLRGLRLTKKDE